MSLKDDLIEDESIFFDVDDFAKPIRITTLKGAIRESLGVFDENNASLIMNEGMETNNFNAIIDIPLSVFSELSKKEPMYKGWVILDIESKKEWDILSITSKDEVSVSLICKRDLFSKAKA